MNILIVFTFGYSLKIWKNSNILERELSIYKDINEKFGTNLLLTFGDSSDVELITEKENFSVIPIYDYLKKPKTKLSFLQSFIVPFKLKNHLRCIFGKATSNFRSLDINYFKNITQKTIDYKNRLRHACIRKTRK